MKTIIVNGALGVCVGDEPIPTLNYGKLKIRNYCSLVSPGTELFYIKKCIIENSKLMLGYCSAGIVLEVGDGVSGFEVGDKVIAMGWGYATHSEVVVVPYKLCVKIPNSLSFERSVFANLNATALHAIHRAGLHQDDKVLVVGAGLVGQLVARSSKLITNHVIVADCIPEKLISLNMEGIESIKLSVDNYSLSKFYNQFTKIFLCIHGDVSSKMFTEFFNALNKNGNLLHRSNITIVGRIKAQVPFSVEMGNIDIKYSARCGEGYRNEEYARGLITIPVLPGEASVTDNLENSVDLIATNRLLVDGITSEIIGIDNASEVYKNMESVNTLLGILFKYN